MDHIFKKAKEGNYLHHAYVVLGDREFLIQKILSGLSGHFGVHVENNPDLVVSTHNTLGVDEAHTLSRAQSRGTLGAEDSRKIFVVAADAITSQAQNALLKTFEEPTPNTHFFIVLPRINTLLPTLRSRVFVVDMRTEKAESIQALAQEFLSADLETRFSISKKLSEKKKDDVIDRESVRAFVDALEALLARGSLEKKGAALATLYEVKQYLASQGSSPKMLLDHLAIVLASTRKGN